MNHEPFCPVCHPVEENPGTDNIKICPDCADALEFAGDVEVELCRNYCLN